MARIEWQELNIWSQWSEQNNSSAVCNAYILSLCMDVPGNWYLGPSSNHGGYIETKKSVLAKQSCISKAEIKVMCILQGGAKHQGDLTVIETDTVLEMKKRFEIVVFFSFF